MNSKAAFIKILMIKNYSIATILTMPTLINSGQNVMHLTNKQLGIILNGCMLNQRGAQKEVYRIYYRYAMSIALRYSSSYDNAIEMTNDAFLKIYK